MTSKNIRILIVDDDQDFCELIKDYLTKNNFEVAVAYHGKAMNQYLANYSVDLFILDVMLPDENGLLLAQQLRAKDYYQPIIMLSAAAKEEVHRIAGLEIGADDYLPKPVSCQEILAHIQAMLRRYSLAYVKAKKVHTFGPYALHTSCRCLMKEDVEVKITNTEYHLLLAFLTHPNQVLKRNRLMSLTKGYAPFPYYRGIDVNVKRLRDKIETDSRSPYYIRTVRGEGYLFFIPNGSN